MVARKARGQVSEVNAKLSAKGSGLRIVMAPLAQCDLLEKNARFMPVEQYRRLVENIKRDGQLTSVPFAVEREGRYLILSGNHRVKAAQDAGLTEILILCAAAGSLTHEEQVAIQLSHNAIAGQDDLAILRELYDEIGDVALKEYSGLDDALFGRMQPPNMDPLSEEGLEFRMVTIAFLPHEQEHAEALLAKVLERSMGDAVWVNRFTEYDRMLDALAEAKAQAGIKNTATAFGLLLDIVERHLDELPQRETTKAQTA